MSRDWLAFLDDMVQALRHIRAFTNRFTREEILDDIQVRWSFERAFEIVGEAAKHIPEDVKQRHPEVDWRGLAGFRDVLSHGYYRVNPHVVWSLSAEKAVSALEHIERILGAESPPAE